MYRNDPDSNGSRNNVPRVDGTSWVRTALQQCRMLELRNALDPVQKQVIVFAIRWAPFGGAGAEELFSTFGVTRKRFLQMIREALGRRPSDDTRAQELKKHLLLSLAWAWRADAAAAERAGSPDATRPAGATPADLGDHRQRIPAGGLDHGSRPGKLAS